MYYDVNVVGYNHFGSGAGKCVLFNDADIANWNLEINNIGGRAGFDLRQEAEALYYARRQVGIIHHEDPIKCPLCGFLHSKS